MSSKVLFIKYVPHLLRGDQPHHKSLLAAAQCTAPHGVLLQTKSGALCIQGFPDIPCTHKHQSWSLFKDAMKALLGVPQSGSVCIRFSEPPCSPVTSVTEILAEPSHIVQLLVTPLPHSTHLTLPPTPRAHSTQVTLPPPSRAHFTHPPRSSLSRGPRDHTPTDPYCQYKERFKPNASSTIKHKCDYSDMERLLSQLDQVSESLQRTQRACDALMTRSNSASQFTDSGNGSTLHDSEEGTTEDARIEQLLRAAESAIHQQPPPPPNKDVCKPATVRAAGADDVCLPDAPTGVTVQPSLTQGGIYILWNPVRLDADNMNHGHTVLGYKVHLDKRMKLCVEGGLASGAELLGNQLEEGVEYTVQVCTHTNHCNSLLSKPLLYRHCSKLAPPSRTNTNSITTRDKTVTASRVESWLLNGTMSTSLSPTHRSAASEGCRKWAGSDSHTLDSGCEDTHSHTSSLTSGIVTDCPFSPHILHCSHTDAHSFSTRLPSTSDDGFHTLTRCDCHQSLGNMLLSPSNRTSRAGSLETIIDEPEEVDSPSPWFRVSAGRRPAAPESVSAYLDPADRHWIIVEWTPVSRDVKGCNNGFFILGYRVYINDTPQSTVNGAMTSRVRVAVPFSSANHTIKLDIRSRAMAGESLPSHPVNFNHISRPRPAVRCRSAVSGVSMATDSSTRTILAQNLVRVETFV